MNADWLKTSLGQLREQGKASVQTGPFGTVLKAAEYSSSGVPVVSVGEIRCGFIEIHDRTPVVSDETKNRLPQFVLEEGDIVFGRKGGIDRNALVSRKEAGWFLGSDGIRLRLSNAIDSTFVSYQFRSPMVGKWLLGNSSGSIMPSLNEQVLGRLPLWLPEFVEQQKIAAVLSALDAKIDLNNRINAELEALAKTIYDYWFVQFDFPDDKGRPYKTSGGKMAYNTNLRREIPEKWVDASIGQACETILGGTPHTKNPEYWDNADIPWLSSGETSQFPVVASEQCITSAGIRDSAAKVLPPGTVVVSIVRYIRPSILGISAATNQSVAGILETALFPSSYLYPAVCREVPRWMDLRTGAQQPHINKATIDETCIVQPSESVIATYRKVADPIFKRILVAANENLELTQLRDWLLPMLMTGQVKVA